jgi:hypothetical protein
MPARPALLARTRLPLAPLRRLLSRKAVALPLAVVLLAAVAFAGYGAWTRSRPVHYARGGDQFAVVTDATPTPPSATSSAAPRATASPTASAAARTPGTQAISPQAAPTVEPVGSAATTAPAAPRVKGVAVPRVGRYALQVEGSEKVDFGPVSFCSQSLPKSTDLVVSKAAGEGPTSYDFDLPYFPGQAGKHDERHLYRYTKDAVFLDYEIATVTCQGVRQSSDTDYSPPQARVRLPLSVGRSWTTSGGDADRTDSTSNKVVRTETLTVRGVRVPTYVIETTTSFTGSESGSRTQTWWYAPRRAMPLKWSEHIDGRRSGAAYSEDVTVTVVSGP